MPKESRKLETKLSSSSSMTVNSLNRTALALLGHLRAHGRITRTDLASIMGLTRVGLSKVANPLLSAGVIRSVEEINPQKAQGRGRPSQFLMLGDKAPKGLGISVGLHIDLVVIDYGNRILAEKRLANRLEGSVSRENATVEEALGECRKLLERAGVDILSGIGLVVSGDLTEDGQWISRVNSFTSVKQANRLVSRLRESFQCPTYLANDAWVGVLVERWLSESLPKQPTLLFVTSTLGVGLIIEGRLYKGPVSWSRWLGHFQVDPNGLQCHCGKKGCLCVTSWIWGMLDRLAGFQHGMRPALSSEEADNEREMFLARYGKGDPIVLELMREAYSNLGVALRNIEEIFAFDAIVLDPLAGEADDAGLAIVRAALEEGGSEIYKAAKPRPCVRHPILGDRQMAVGAVLYAFDCCEEAFAIAPSHSMRE